MKYKNKFDLISEINLIFVSKKGQFCQRNLFVVNGKLLSAFKPPSDLEIQILKKIIRTKINRFKPCIKYFYILGVAHYSCNYR